MFRTRSNRHRFRPLLATACAEEQCWAFHYPGEARWGGWRCFTSLNRGAATGAVPVSGSVLRTPLVMRRRRVLQRT